MPARVAGIGQWLPERIRDNSAWPEDFGSDRKRSGGDRTLVDFNWSGANSGTHALVERYLASEGSDPFLGGTRRRVAGPDVSSSEAEVHAARAALSDAGVSGAEVDAVLSWALVPDRIMPSNACHVAAEIGAGAAWAASVDSACASPIAQLTMAAALVESGRARTVLLTQSHLASRTFPLSHPASPGVGDAATALVVQASERPGIQSVHSVTHGEHRNAVIWCRDKDPEKDVPWWQPGGPQFMGSHAPENARALIRGTVQTGVTTISELAERGRFELDSIDVLACIQPRRWVPEAVAEGLGLAKRIAPQTYDELAHLGGAGAVANLLAARQRGLLTEGCHAVLYAQGAGFTRGAVSIRW